MLSKVRRRLEQEQGFTLIELLVVILIIGILAAVAIPTFLSQKSKASDSNAQSDLKNAQTIVESAANGDGGQYPSATGKTLDQALPNDSDAKSLSDVHYDYTGSDPTNPVDDSYTLWAQGGTKGGTTYYWGIRESDGTTYYGESTTNGPDAVTASNATATDGFPPTS